MRGSGSHPAAESGRSSPTVTTGENQILWRSLEYFSHYRLIVAGLLLVSGLAYKPYRVFGEEAPQAYLWTSGIYFLAALAFSWAMRFWRRGLDVHLGLQILGDVIFLTAIQYTSGGIKSGVAMMTVVALAGASLVGQGRQVLFFAAIATLALLAEHAYRVLAGKGDAADFLIVGMTALAFFGVSIVGRLLAKRVVVTAELARRRGLELAEQQRINERVIRDMQDGILLVDGEGRMRSWNPQASRLLGFEADLERDEPLPRHAPALDRIHRDRHSLGLEYETVLAIPRTGRTLRVRYLPPEKGGTALFFLEDAGRRQQLAQQAKLAALGRLTANLAHEIRNPLAAISHAAELLLDDPTAKDGERLLRIIGDNVQRINRLVGEIQELGKRDRASPELLQPAAVLAQMIEEIALSRQIRKERFALEISPQLTICFDRAHFYRIMINLLDNALRYASEAKGAIRIISEAGQYRQRMALHVIDDGCGIDEAGRERVFEPFFSSRASGMGLGLYIARELAEANGARLFLLENSPGAHFCLSCLARCPEPTTQN